MQILYLAFFKRCFTYAKDLGALFGEELSMPRTAARQRHRANAEAQTPLESWLRNAYLPFLDHIVGIDSRFDKYGAIVHRMAGLVPMVAAQRDDVSITDAVEEFIRWKWHWKEVNVQIL